MILQVWNQDCELAINRVVRNENEGLGIGLEYFQHKATNLGAGEPVAPQVKIRKRPRHEKDAHTGWDIRIAWPEGNEKTYGRIVILD